MKTKTAAIKHARANVKLYQVGRQWQLSTWDARARAWRQGPLRGRWAARAHQSQELIDHAREFLDKGTVQYDGGAWTLYV